MSTSPAPRFGRGVPARVPPLDSPDRYIFIERPRCQKCGGVDLNVYRTMGPESDGSVRRYVRCGDCLSCYILVAE